MSPRGSISQHWRALDAPARDRLLLPRATISYPGQSALLWAKSPAFSSLLMRSPIHRLLEPRIPISSAPSSTPVPDVGDSFASYVCTYEDASFRESTAPVQVPRTQPPEAASVRSPCSCPICQRRWLLSSSPIMPGTEKASPAAFRPTSGAHPWICCPQPWPGSSASIGIARHISQGTILSTTASSTKGKTHQHETEMIAQTRPSTLPATNPQSRTETREMPPNVPAQSQSP